ncbi:MAG: amino acid adenylation domain-containing protein, partial [Cyclobacteriaceae bacterium]
MGKKLFTAADQILLCIEPTQSFYHKSIGDIKPLYITPNNLCYVIYTSGTTGKPKGVMIEHHTVINLVNAMRIRLKNRPSDRYLQYFSLVFDASVVEIFSALLTGSTLYIASHEERVDTELLEKLISENQINTVYIPPVVLASLDTNALKSVRNLSTGGEASNAALVETWTGNRLFINSYGPTETTVIATTRHMVENDNGLIIGKPLANNKVYVLDANHQPVPVGVTGELFIGGEGVGRGYLNRKELTAERFLPNPFTTEKDRRHGRTRMYRTGDLVRWSADGHLEFLGRIDKQVKVRGHRIELGEVENALQKIKGIEAAVVIIREGKTKASSDRFLAGYFVSEIEGHSVEDLIKELSSSLPDYMIPAAIMQLDAIPLTINGKTDFKKLPAVSFANEENQVIASTDLEKKLTEIYSETLGIPSSEIGINQNFFKMGGNSILAIHLKKKLVKLDDFAQITVADLYQYNSINKLVESLGEASKPTIRINSQLSAARDHEIAIVGISGAFAGAQNPDRLWELISNQAEGLAFFDEYEHPEVDRSKWLNDHFVPVSGKVEGIDVFDPGFWGMSPNEGKLLNPQIRKFLEHSWYVLEAAGYSQSRKEHNIGVYAGSGNDSYYARHVLNGIDNGTIDQWEAVVSNHKDAIATKTAFLLGLTGPANAINTACSTALVAIVEACKNLYLGTCDMALAGASSFSSQFESGYDYKAGGILSPDGHCRPFDINSGGTVMTSGVGVVLLKRLADARRDQDPILGVIKGYATNNDGDRKVGYTSPSITGQSEAVANAQVMAGVSRNDIDYIECHGTGTNIGDPIELQALNGALEINSTSSENIAGKIKIGSVKANIGHSDSASGMAGLIKVCQMLSHKTIPAQANFTAPNPELNLSESYFEVTDTNTEWKPKNGKQRIAGLSAFGIGGTNAHIVIGDYQQPNTDQPEEKSVWSDIEYIIPFSAKSEQSLVRQVDRIREFLAQAQAKNQQVEIGDLVYTLQNHRQHFQYRSALTARSVDELIGKLASTPMLSKAGNFNETKTVFMFPGQGSQFPKACQALYDSDSLYKTCVDECVAIANQYLNKDITQLLFSTSKEDVKLIHETEWTQVILFILEYATARYLIALGVTPDILIGHSIGEFVAATLCKVFSLEDALRVVIRRGQLMQSADRGKMLAVHAPEEAVATFAKKFDLDIAVVNAYDKTVVAGEESKIEALSKLLEEHKIAAVLLKTSHAFHSKMMTEAAAEFRKFLEDIDMQPPSGSFISNLTGQLAGKEVATPEYWLAHLTGTVRFANGIETIGRVLNGKVRYIETGPGRSLSSFVKTYTKAGNYRNIAILALFSEKTGRQAINAVTRKEINAALWTTGLPVKLNSENELRNAKLLTNLPGYAFEEKSLWIEKSLPVQTTQTDAVQLPPEKWVNQLVWSQVCRLRSPHAQKPLYERVIVFLTKVQLEQFDHQPIAKTVFYVVLDRSVSELSTGEKDGFSCIRINPASEDHFRDLALFLKNNDLRFDSLIHAGSAGFPTTKEEVFTNSFFTLYLLHKHLIGAFSTDSILVLTSGISQISAIDQIIPVNGTLKGMVQSLRNDFPEKIIQLIDIGDELETSGLSQLLRINKTTDGNETLAIRSGRLWREKLENVFLQESNPVFPEDEVNILFTGGLQYISLALAVHISRSQKVNCLFISLGKNYTETIDPTLQTFIDQIEANGSSYSHHAISSSDLQSTSFTDSILANGRKLTGLIYFDDPDDMAIQSNDSTAIADLLQSRIWQIEQLMSQISTSNLQFISIQSSLTAIFGDTESYASAAFFSYLDTLASDDSISPDTNFTAINWPDWSEDHKDQAFSALSPTNDIGLLWQAIAQENYSRLAVSKLDIPSILKQLGEPQKENLSGGLVKVLEDEHTEEEMMVSEIIGNILGLTQVSVMEDFFSMGGNSLLGIQVAHRINEQLSMDIKVADLFQYPNIRQLLAHAIRDNQSVIAVIPEKTAALSFSQERLWFIETYEGGTDAYHLPLILELLPETSTAILERAVQAVIKRHEVLRSVIVKGLNGQWLQEVKENPLTFSYFTTDTASYQSELKKEISRPFDLTGEYPIRVSFFNVQGTDGEKTTFVLVMFHHIASDGWSIEVFGKEIYEYLNAWSSGNDNFDLPALAIQYKDFSVWQRNKLSGVALSAHADFWKEYLSGYETLDLPTDYPRPVRQQYDGDIYTFHIPLGLSNRLREMARSEGVSLYSTLLASISVLLGKYSGLDDVVTGSPHANRAHYQTGDMIGFFVNTLVNRVTLRHGESFSDLIKRVHSNQVSSQEHQDLPFEQLMNLLSVARDSSRHPLFQVMFTVQSYGYSKMGDIEQFAMPLDSSEYQVEKFDLSVFMDDNGDQIKVLFSYAKSLFKPDTITEMADRYLNLLDRIVNLTEIPYSQHSLLNETDYQQLIVDHNVTLSETAPDKTVIAMFEEQVLQHPENRALIFEEQSLTYLTLNQKANQVAHALKAIYLSKTGVELSNDTLIGICFERSPEMVIAILAVAKAGGAYLAIDPKSPDSRIDFLLEDSEVPIVLTHAATDRLFTDRNISESLTIDFDQEIYNTMSTVNLAVSPKCHDLFTAIYTSGTTGKPKGVLIEHHTISNTTLDLLEVYRNVSTTTFYTSYVFDVSIFEIFASLLTGSKLHIMSDAIRLNVHALSEYLTDNKIGLCYIPPVLLKDLPVKEYPHLQYILYAGEPCDQKTAEKWTKHVKLWNYYGPTEASICVAKEIKSAETHLIGRPVRNTTAYVLDSHQNPVPCGVTGELYIGGAGVSRGYLKRPDLTGERYLSDPFASETQKSRGYTRMYKTGDLVKWTHTGDLEYIGRNDDQVKVRGYRIETGEVAAALLSVAGVTQSAVIVRERDDNKYLVAYFVSDQEDSAITNDYLRNSLSELLADYMIPAAFVKMDKFPMTVNGKLDKRRLPDPELKNESDFVAPHTELETTLCHIWSEVLGIDQIGLTDHFFMSGGNSLLAMRLVHRINELLSFDVKVSAVFQFPTVRKLLENGIDRKSIAIPKITTTKLPLSPSQERLWFIELYERGTNAYHIPWLLELSNDIALPIFKKAVRSIVSRHSVLRSILKENENKQWVQEIQTASLAITSYKCDNAEYLQLIESDINRPFNLQEEYPLRVCLYKVNSDNGSAITRALILFHHIAGDGWSLDIFSKELNEFYQAYTENDEHFELPELPIQYGDYAYWQR